MIIAAMDYTCKRNARLGPKTTRKSPSFLYLSLFSCWTGPLSRPISRSVPTRFQVQFHAVPGAVPLSSRSITGVPFYTTGSRKRMESLAVPCYAVSRRAFPPCSCLVPALYPFPPGMLVGISIVHSYTLTLKRTIGENR